MSAHQGALRSRAVKLPGRSSQEGTAGRNKTGVSKPEVRREAEAVSPQEASPSAAPAEETANDRRVNRNILVWFLVVPLLAMVLLVLTRGSG